MEKAQTTPSFALLARTLDWRLLAGSHEFPGPDGGTCINEAAVVAAGRAYAKMDGFGKLPPDFSRPLAHTLMWMNDAMEDQARQGLKIFVTRLPGSAAIEAIEAARADLVINRVFTDVLKPVVPAVEFDAFAADRWPTARVRLAEFVGTFASLMFPHQRPGWPVWIGAMSAAFDLGGAEPVPLDVAEARLAGARWGAAMKARREMSALVCGND